MNKIDKICPQLESVAVEHRVGPLMAERLTEIANALDDNSISLKRAGLGHHSKAVVVAANNLSSLADCITAQEGSLKHYRDVLERATVFDASVDQINAEWANKATGKPMGEFASAIPTLTEALGNVDLTGFESASGKDIASSLLKQSERNRVIRSSLPRKSVKDYALVQLPVVLVMNRQVNVEAMKRAGFEARNFEGYPLIEEQIMLAVNQQYAKDWDTDIHDKANEILSAIAKGTGQRFTMVDAEYRVPKDASRDFAYYWIVPDAYYGRLLPLISGYTDWSIAM